MKGWGSSSGGGSTRSPMSLPVRLPGVPGFGGFAAVIAMLTAFHATFILMLRQAIASSWFDLPAAIVLTLVHVSVGSIASAWLARVLPRVFNSPFETRWLSVMTASFLLAVGTSAWLGRMTFAMIPTQWVRLDFGFVGLFLAIPCSIYFWQLGKTFSW